MLAGPLPASAAAPAFVLDPNYGGANAAVKGVATAGLTNTPGVDAVTLATGTPSITYRYVLAQQKSGTWPVTLVRLLPTGVADTAFGGGNGKVVLTGLPANTVVSRLLTDGTNLYVVGQNGFNVIIAKVDATGAAATYGSTGIATLSTGLSGTGTTFTIADAKLHSSLGSDAATGGTGAAADDANGVVVAINVTTVSGTTTTNTAWLLRATGTTTAGNLDTNFGTAGRWQVMSGATPATMVGGIVVRGTTDTVNPTGIVGTMTLAPENTTGADTQSQLFQVSPVAAAPTGVTAYPVTSFETASDTAGMSNEMLSDIVELGAGTGSAQFLVAGRTSSSYFLTRVGANTATTLDTTFGTQGIGQPVTASCASGAPQIALDNATTPTRYYLAVDRTCAGSKPEFVRYGVNGLADTTFNNGSAVWSPDIPVNARPLMASATGLNFGAWNTSGTDVSSGQAVVPTAPTVTVASSSSAVTSGTSVTLTATIGGVPAPTVQWQWAPYNGTNFTNIPDATASTYQFRASLARSGYQYRAVVTNAYGQSATSTPTTVVTVYAGAPVVTTNPDSKTVSVNSPVSFTVAWAGEPDATVQWQGLSPASGATWTNIPDATKATLTVPKPMLDMSGYQYRAVLTNSNGTATSNVATLTVTPQVINVTKQPEDQTVDEGGNATFAVMATGNSALSYQWQWSKTGADASFESIPGATSASYTLHDAKASQDGTVFQVKITDAANNVEYSTKAKLTVKVAGHPTPTNVAWADYDGDGKSDIATFRPSDGSFNWMSKQEMFGKAGDRAIVGNFDDDKASDMAVVRGNTWVIDHEAAVAFGKSTDTPVSGDFDGDGKTDIAVFRSSNGTWYWKGGPAAGVQYGAAGDVPVVADYNGDGKDDFAVWRPSNTTWYVKGVGSFKWGAKGDIVLRGDWNGDGNDDMVVFRPSNATWYFYGGKSVRWGRGSDIPLAGDFDGDGQNDLALFRPSENKWYFAEMDTVQFGKTGDWPLPR
ncbi:FG-GAP-like repeat-containing protein [Cryptosporangium phraense]|nr:FG-GAP-like repeat-containing protein [Cryptosporangium phraense]